MKITPWLWVFSVLFLSSALWPPPTEAKEKVYSHEGRHFIGLQDPDYKEYEIALKDRIKERIQKKFGVEIPSEAYSGFDLLEIESFLRVRRPGEPLDQIFKMFPRAP